MRIARMPLKLLALADIDENKLSFFFISPTIQVLFIVRFASCFFFIS
jgi:hypothetical protein